MSIYGSHTMMTSNAGMTASLYPAPSMQFSSDGDDWYDSGSADGGNSSSAEQTEITLDERTGIWTGNN